MELVTESAEGSAPKRMGTARLKENVELPGGDRYSRADTFYGEVAFGLHGHPVGIYVEVKDTARAHLANIDRHYIPEGNCKSITLKKQTSA